MTVWVVLQRSIEDSVTSIVGLYSKESMAREWIDALTNEMANNLYDYWIEQHKVSGNG